MSEEQCNNAVEVNWDFWCNNDYMRILKSGVPLSVNDSSDRDDWIFVEFCSKPEIYRLPSIVSLLKSAPLIHKETASYALCRACKSEDIDSVRELLIEGVADINNVDWEGLTPLMHSTLKNNTSVVSLLLKYKELVLDKVTEEGSTALHLACYGDGTSFPLIPLLGSDKRCTPVMLNKKGNEGLTPLMGAVECGNLECIKEMEKLQGTNFRTENKFGEGLLDVAWRRSRKKSRKEDSMRVLEYLLNRKKVESLKEQAARAVACLLSCDTDVVKLDIPLILHPWVAGFMRTSPIMNDDSDWLTESDSDSSDEEEEMLISSDDMDEDEEDDGWNTFSSNDENDN